MAREREQRDDDDETPKDDGSEAADREDEQGLSTAKKVVAGAAIGAVAVPAAVGAARKLMGSDGSDQTREQLYRQATRLKIEGRSRMTKAQLARAVERAGKR